VVSFSPRRDLDLLGCLGSVELRGGGSFAVHLRTGEPFDEHDLVLAGVVEVERPAHLLEPIARKFGECLGECRLFRGGDRLDEAFLGPAIRRRQQEAIDDGEQLIAGERESTSRFEGMSAMRLRRLAWSVQGCIRFGVLARTKPKGTEMITIKEAASILGVSEMTLRRWDAAGKFRARRHPINSYRLYRRADVTKLRKRIVLGERAA
jgi:excisionase family DNA binding protein